MPSTRQKILHLSFSPSSLSSSCLCCMYMQQVISMASQTSEPVHFTNLRDKIQKKDPLHVALLVFVLLLCFLFVYFLYACIHRRHEQEASSNSDGGGISRRSSASMGLDAASVSQLPIFCCESSSINNNNNKLASQDGECCICLSIFQEGDKVKVLPLCHHGFHSECVDRWLKTRSSCPLCRVSVHLQLQPPSSADDMEIP